MWVISWANQSSASNVIDAKQLFKVGGFGGRANHKGALIVKAAIGRQNMQVWMEILEVAKTLHGDCSTGSGIVIRDGLRQVDVEHLPCAPT